MTVSAKQAKSGTTEVQANVKQSDECTVMGLDIKGMYWFSNFSVLDEGQCCLKLARSRLMSALSFYMNCLQHYIPNHCMTTFTMTANSIICVKNWSYLHACGYTTIVHGAITRHWYMNSWSFGHRYHVCPFFYANLCNRIFPALLLTKNKTLLAITNVIK